MQTATQQIHSQALSPLSMNIDGQNQAKQQALRKAKLVMVTANNNNKYYEMQENLDGTFTVNYGRVGSRGSIRQYPISQWESKKREKIRKGYKDTSYLFSEQQDLPDFLQIDEVQIEMLMRELIQFAQQSVSDNYNVSSKEVSKQQIREAQYVLDQLSKKVNRRMDVRAFNQSLIDLYALIPRKMRKVQEHLIEKPKSKQDLSEIQNKLVEEQATLDVMRGQVELNEKQAAQQNEPVCQTLLDAFGLKVNLLENEKMIAKIKGMMGGQAACFHKAYEVTNIATQSHFDVHMQGVRNKKTELFWHGSRNENWLSILKTGLVLRPANAIINGKMFGYGLYFADRFAKSLNYSSLRGSYWSNGNSHKGYLALYDVHVGKQLKVKKHDDWCYQLNEENLKKRGRRYNSLFAKGGADLINNEYIIYNQNQCTIRYLVEVR
ncbi:MAG: WGR domain-containing protein [Bacteroidota bacterium]